MATSSGQRHSYSNTQPLKRTVTDKILLVDPNEIVALNVLGLNNESKFQLINTPGQQYEWLEDTYRVVTDTGNDNDIDTNTTEATLTVTTGAKFSTGDIITWGGDAELMYVTTISGDVLTVVRGFGGTNATTHVTNGTVAIRFRARIEGATATASTMTEVTTGVNFSMILQKTIDITRTAGLDPDLYCGIDIAHNTPYEDDNSIMVIFGHGRARQPSEVSFILDRLRNETLTRVRVIFASELRDRIRDALFP